MINRGLANTPAWGYALQMVLHATFVFLCKLIQTITLLIQGRKSLIRLRDKTISVWLLKLVPCNNYLINNMMTSCSKLDLFFQLAIFLTYKTPKYYR